MPSLLCLPLLLILFMTTGIAWPGPDEQELDTLIERYRPLACKASSSPLFQAQPNDILELEMIADFAHINTDIYSDDTGGDSGILSYRDGEGRWRDLPVFIRDRGNSRRDFCEWVPLRILFDAPRLKQALEKRVPATLPLRERLVAKYRELKTRHKGRRPARGVPQKGNLFRKLGDDIKLVTHCGKSSWRHVGGETREAQEGRLLQEYYLYRILDRMETVTLKTRLTRITYRDPDGNPLTTRLAFFREPKSRLAKRCGLYKRPPPGSATGEFDETAWFQLELFNAFIYFRDYGRDGRNVNLLYRTDGRIVAGPYDFDLSGIIVPEYRPNRLSVEENLQRYFSPWLGYHDGEERAVVQVHFMLDRRQEMRRVLERALLDEEKKRHMLSWFDSHMNELERFRERNRRLLPALLERLENRHRPGDE